jgi:hypothetical protein
MALRADDESNVVDDLQRSDALQTTPWRILLRAPRHRFPLDIDV